MSQLITCPECKKHLQVPDDLIGKKVQCPECKHTFIAEATTPTEVVSSTTSVPKRTSPSASSAGAKKKAEWDDDDDNEEEERSSKSKPPAKKRRDDDDDDEEEDDDDDDDRPRRRRRRSRSRFGGYAPDRSGQILVYGILSLAFFAIMPFPFSLIFGLIAWLMGNGDLAEIRAGRMDPTNEGAVQTGRILGIVSVTLSAILILVVAGFFCCIIGAAMQKPR